jgi:amino acid adenylation domain-containing protein
LFAGQGNRKMPNLTSSRSAAFHLETDHGSIYTGFKPSDYPKDKTMTDLFEDQVKKTPGNVAVIFDDVELTYHELNKISNQLADYLKKTYCIKPDDLVGIMLDRSEWLIAAILGVLKAGGGYVPIAVDYPEERINYLVKDSNCKLLINKEELKRFRWSQDVYDQENRPSGSKANHLMYCIYTSGSTGLPKGVLIEHKTVVNLICSQQKEFGITKDERILQFSSVSFDASVEQMWLALLSGAALVMVGKSCMNDVKALEKYIIDKKVTHIHTVPAYLNELSVGDMRHLKRVIAGGDVCPPYLAEKWVMDCTFYNEYGPTETTVTCIEYKSGPNDGYNTFVPVGKPIANTDIYILDEFQRSVPFGEIGELYIGGDGVARGYLNRPVLNAEKFLNDPYQPGHRMYRTGDLGRWLPDGNLEYVGRIDEQVKISGFRIELGEISSVLQLHSKVRDAVVIATKLNGEDKELIAYTTGDAEAAELKQHLADNLPPYMVPAYYVQLPALPLNGNGKVDRKELPLPAERYHQSNQNYAEPTTLTEKTVADVWQHILNITRVGIDDNFFDLGGTSLMVIRIINQVNERTGANLRLASLYQLPTIRALANQIDNGSANENSPVVQLKKGTGTPLFIFPPWSSYPTIFNEFVSTFTGDNPLYGIIYTEDTEFFPFQNVQEYAAYLIEHFKKLHPTGPYGLLGYSLGARTILEVALQLQQANDKVALLGVISHYPAYAKKRLFLSRRICDEIRVFWNIGLDLKLKYLQHRLPYFLKLLTNGNNDVQEIKLEIDSQKRLFAIHELYETNKKFDGNMVLIYEKSPDRDPSEYKKVQVYRNSIFQKLWQPYITGRIVMKNVETKHIDFFKQPAVKQVASIVDLYLR